MSARSPTPNKMALDALAMRGFVQQFLINDYDEKRSIPRAHMEWWELACSPHRYIAFAAPREHAKTTAINHAYGLATALFQLSPFQIKVSKTYQLACEKIEQAKETMLTNEKLQHFFGFNRLVRERENDFICEMKDGYHFRMMALGMGQAARGLSWGTMRPTLFNVDDGEDDEEVLNAERREKAWRWLFNTLLPMGGDNTLFRIYGTILHADSMLARLIKLSNWHGKIWSACDEEVSQESILWPEKFPRERLLATRQGFIDAGNLVGFNMEYRNIARDTTSGFFLPEDFRRMTEEDEERLGKQNLTYYVGGDFAISTKEKRDYTVFIVAAMDQEGMLYAVDRRKGRWDGNQIIDEMLSIELTYAPEEWFLEDGHILKALTPAIEIKMREYDEGRGLYMNITPMIPVKDKRTRARSIQARMRAKGVKFNKDSSWYADFEQNMLEFDRGEHDDDVDAFATLGLGLRRMVTPISKDEEEDIELVRAQRETLTLGRSEVTGY